MEQFYTEKDGMFFLNNAPEFGLSKDLFGQLGLVGELITSGERFKTLAEGDDMMDINMAEEAGYGYLVDETAETEDLLLIGITEDGETLQLARYIDSELTGMALLNIQKEFLPILP